MHKLVALLLAPMALASCGGDSGSSGDDQSVLDQMNAAQAQAVALAASQPCNAAAQCGVLTLTQVSGHCTAPDYRVYSLVSPTADAASAAAASERALAEQAANLAPPSACTASVRVPPEAACVAGTCQASPPGN